MRHCPEATALKRDGGKRDISKQDNLKRPVCHVWSIKGQIKIIFNIVQSYDFIIKEFNLTYSVQKMANRTFQIVPFGNVPFPSVPFECSCLWALSLCCSGQSFRKHKFRVIFVVTVKFLNFNLEFRFRVLKIQEQLITLVSLIAVGYGINIGG